ncbi:MAG: GntR family transcriptional regulator [Fimbriimonas sp.]
MPRRSPPRFDALARAIRADIQRGVLAPGSLLPTERELQEAHGLSRTTVRRALAELIETGWAENLPNRGVLARLGRSSSQSTRIAFIDHREDVHKSLFFRLHTLLADRGFVLVQVDSHAKGTVGAMEAAADDGFAAAFVWAKNSFVSPDALARIQARMPVVFVDHTSGGEPVDLVMSDHLAGAREVVGHLLDLGRRRIAITGNFTHHEDATFRFAGYMAAHYDRGLIPHACDFVFSSPGNGEFEDPRLLQFRLRERDRPDAVFVLHDMSVPAVVAAIYDSGLRVPQDVAVVGFGNDLPFTIDGVGLTTVGMNWDQVAEAMVGRLLYRLERPAAPCQRTLVPTRLVVRGSCGASEAVWSAEGYEISSVTVTRRMLKRQSDAEPTLPNGP